MSFTGFILSPILTVLAVGLTLLFHVDSFRPSLYNYTCIGSTDSLFLIDPHFQFSDDTPTPSLPSLPHYAGELISILKMLFLIIYMFLLKNRLISHIGRSKEWWSAPHQKIKESRCMHPLNCKVYACCTRQFLTVNFKQGVLHN